MSNNIFQYYSLLYDSDSYTSQESSLNTFADKYYINNIACAAVVEVEFNLLKHNHLVL